jgi:Integrase zinc binding domain/RNase H-like domain found in reverse transcriptase
LLGANHPVHIITDYKNLVKFTTTKELTQRHARWSEILSAYDFRITHRKGIENRAADALSCSPKYQEEQSRPELTLLKFEGEELRPTHYVGMIVAEYPEGPDMKKKYENDEYFQEHQKEFVPQKNGWYHITGGRYLPESMHRNLICDMHEHRLVGHPGREHLAELLDRSYFIPGKTKKIAEVIDNCKKCHTSKPVWQKPQGRLQPIPVPSEPWEGIAFDLIVKLPTSVEPLTRCAYDSIWVVADYLMKYAYFIPYKEASSVEELAYAVLRTVIAAHGVPRYIIIDRAKVYTSKFWESLMAKIGVDQRHSIAYHPQTDSMVERLNQTLEQYLRIFVN